ncbi:MAG TPA: nicotinamide-nucleotide amidohydrolase family protein [Cyclobacteriaceae bacterium]|nr:nicotinamide-nucleotide amidohydrolase family protein [Cyclobacteriaceae bacterium]
MQSLSASLDVIRKKLVSGNETLGVAESVTAGNLQSAFSLAKDATEFFQGGLTLYNTGQKARHLFIDPIIAERTNCVSEKIAQSMAKGACKFFSSDWGIGITGYAAPVPEWNVGNTLFAWYAIAYRNVVVLTEKMECKKMEMSKVQQFYVRMVLRQLAKYLEQVA